MSRHHLERLDFSKLPAGSHDQLVTWLKDNGLKAENIPQRGAYVVRDVLGGGYVLVARRYVRDTRGQRIPMKGIAGWQTTILISTPVTTPPDFVLAEGVSR